MILAVNNWVSKQSMNRIFGLIVISMIVMAVYQATSHLHLYADGSHFFVNLLSQQSVFNPLQSRFFANTLQQALPLLLIKTGTTDIKLLSFAFGINLYLIPILGIIISYLILDSNRKPLILFPVLFSLFAIHNNYAFIISESFVAVSIFWPLLFFVLFKELRPSSGWIYFASILLISNTHELTFLLLVVLGAALYQRHRNIPNEPIPITFILALSILMALIANLYWTAYQPNPEFSEDFIQQLGKLSSLKQYPLSTAIVVLIFIQFFFRLRGNGRYITVILLGIFMLLIILPLINSSGMLYPIIHWEQRILIIFGAFLLGLILVISQYRSSSLDSVHFPSWSIILVTLLMIAYQIRLTNLWNGFKEDFNSTLMKSSGIVEYNETSMASNPAENQFTTSWTVPTLGFILHTFSDVKVRSLISMPYEIWQPWYARDTYGWPDLSSYNVRYRLFGPNFFLD